MLSRNSLNLASGKRLAYRVLRGAAALLAMPTARRDGTVAIFYGGARAGSRGGPLVKLRQLQSAFPQHATGFSLVYLLSNALYLPDQVLARLQRARIPIVVNQNGVFYPAWHPQGWERENARMGAALARASHVFFQSEFCRACAERFLAARPLSSEILPNAVDTSTFVPTQSRRRAGQPFRFLLTGKIVPSTAYRLTSSLEGLAAARRGGLDVTLTVAGPLESDVGIEGRRVAERLKIAESVTFTGPFSRDAAPAVYQAADAYIMTKHDDPCLNVVLEALACGLPVLYSTSGGVPELVGDQAGIALAVPATFEGNPVPSPQAIADGMARIIADRDACAVAARQRAVERFDLTRWLLRHHDVFTRLVAGAS